MSIQRYYIPRGISDGYRSDLGFFVTYKDHVAALAAQATAHEAALENERARCVAALARMERDTEAALTEAYRVGMREAMIGTGVALYQQGVSDERARIRAGVTALPWSSETWQAHAERAAILAVIDEEDK